MSFYKELTLLAVVRRSARKSLRALPLFLLAFVFMADVSAQSSGTIRGNVKNGSTGKLLYNALVVIEETGQSTYTDEYGIFRFAEVASGNYTVTASYVGLTDNSASAEVGSGVGASISIELTSKRFEGLSEAEVFTLEAYEVDGSDYNSNSIAMNERRNSENLKIVQHAEAFGEIAEGNIGEYLKNLPGVSINYVAADARAIKLRGMGTNFTQVTVDGSQMASAGSGNPIRTFELEQVSLSNIEQLEVSKLPRPDQPANSLGGSVNLVTKNAFTQGGRKISYKAYVNANSEFLDLGSSPGWTPDQSRSKIHPGVELTYSDVFADDRLGVSLTYSQSNQFNIQQRMRMREFGNFADGGFDDLHLLRVDLQDGPKFTHRENVSANFDFKATENSIFSLKTQANWYDSSFMNRNVDWRIRNPDEDVTDSLFTLADERSTAVGGSFRNKFGNTYHVDLGGKHFIEKWRIDYGISRSEATNHYRDNVRGVQETMTTDVNGIDMVSFQRQSVMEAFTDVIAYDDDGNVIPNRGIVLSETDWDRAHSRSKESREVVDSIRVNARRDFTVGENSGYVKFGALYTSQDRSAFEQRFRWNTAGAAKDLSLADFLDTTYVGVSPGFGYEPFSWPSSAQMNEYFLAHPDQFQFDWTDSLNRLRDSWVDIVEDIDAYYVMGSMNFMSNRLNVAGGVRYEDTSVSGSSPINGEVSLDPNSFMLVGNFSDVNTSYNTTHPSLHVSYDLTEKLLLRVSYADTLGRQNFTDMFGTISIDDPDPDDENGSGSISTKNPSLAPRRSDNLDVTLQYYYGQNDLVSVSVFRNDMSNYAGSVSRPVTQADVDALGLPSRVLGGGSEPYDITIIDNFGDATIEGIELDWNQGLDRDFIPEFLRGSSLYANGTFLSTNGDFADTSFEDFSNDFPDFAKKTVSYGFIYNGGPLNVKFRWNIRGDEVFASSTTGLATLTDFTINGEEQSAPLFVEQRKTLDINLEYKFAEKMKLFINGRNATDVPYRQVYYLNDNGVRRPILESEQRFGGQWTVGVKGTF